MPTRQSGVCMSYRKNKSNENAGEKIGFRERLCKSLDLQPDVFERDTLIEVRGGCRATVRGVIKILSYSPNEVRLKTRQGILSVIGKRLFCGAYARSFVEIEGEITDVFQKGYKNGNRIIRFAMVKSVN